LFADLSRVVIAGSRGLGRRLERQDGGSNIETCMRVVLVGRRGLEWQHNIER